jgi:hypothetical protein
MRFLSKGNKQRMSNPIVNEWLEHPITLEFKGAIKELLIEGQESLLVSVRNNDGQAQLIAGKIIALQNILDMEIE